MSTALQVTNLEARIGDLEILRGLDISVPFGEVHAIMGPNGSGKSTFSHVLMGNPEYTASGSALVDGTEIMGMTVDERARSGLFEAFQYPTEVPGVSLDELNRVARLWSEDHKDQDSADQGSPLVALFEHPNGTLRDLIQQNYSYLVFQAIRSCKAKLSEAEEAVLDIPEIDVEVTLTRAEFEHIIADLMTINVIDAFEVIQIKNA